MAYSINTRDFRFDDKVLADRLEAAIRDLRDQLRYTDSERGREHLRDEIDHYESILCQMHC